MSTTSTTSANGVSVSVTMVAQPELEYVHSWHAPLFAYNLLDSQLDHVKPMPLQDTTTAAAMQLVTGAGDITQAAAPANNSFGSRRTR